MKKKHIGSSLNDFLEEEGLLEQSELVALKRVIGLLCLILNPHWNPANIGL